jgi:hypothetical protein
MNYQYHREDLIKYQNHDYVRTALSMLDSVEITMHDYISNKISTHEYIERITPYDKFVWEKYKEKPQNTNIFNSKQNKKNSSWLEMLWTPIFEVVRLEIKKQWMDIDLQLIQNDKVLETVYSSGYIQYKKVDGGVGIKTEKGFIPVFVVENKAGNICSTTFNGVNAQAFRLHQSFPNAKCLFITGNDFNVGKKIGAEIGDDINLVILERGCYKVEEDYPILEADRFERVRICLTEWLKNSLPNDFLNYKTIYSKSRGCLIDKLDNGIITNM